MVLIAEYQVEIVDNDADNIATDHHYEVNDSEAIGECLRRRQRTSGCDQTNLVDKMDNGDSQENDTVFIMSYTME